MGLIQEDTFICLDLEMTGLDLEKDKIIEVAAARFTFTKILDRFETLIDPECDIPKSSQEIHNISEKMVYGKPKINSILPTLFEFIGKDLLIGHGIGFDIALILNAAKQNRLSPPFKQYKYIDTLRMARLYGQCPVNSLERLRQHFNIKAEGAHRAMNDVIVNIEVFKYLSKAHRTTEQLMHRLEKPIRLKIMPLGKHKGRRFEEIPIEYLLWASKKNFDDDLLFSLRSEIKSRKKGNSFEQAINPFSSL